MPLGTGQTRRLGANNPGNNSSGDGRPGASRRRRAMVQGVQSW